MSANVPWHQHLRESHRSGDAGPSAPSTGRRHAAVGLALPRHATFALAAMLVGTAGSTSVAAQASGADVYIVSVVVDAKDPRGRDWDSGSRPDPALYTENLQGRRRWGGCENNHHCTYQSVYIPRGTILRLVDEEEFGDPELIGAGPVPAAPDGRAAIQLGGAQLTIVSSLVVARAAEAAADDAARPRRLEPREVRRLLVGRTIQRTDGAGWTFEPTEPLTARIISQTIRGPQSRVVVWIETNSSSGTEPTSGRVRLLLRWHRGEPVFEAAESISFARTRSRK